MFKSVKVMVTGLLLTALLPVSAMALYDPNNTSEPAEGEFRIMTAIEEPKEGGGSTGSAGSVEPAAGMDTPVSSSELSETTLKRQQEVDEILFKKNYEKIAEMGFKVTHTNPNGDIVEIGINPFNEENANAVYEMVGTEGVTVVEGLNSDIYTTSAADAPDAKGAEEPAADDGIREIQTTSVDAVEDAVLYTTTEKEEKQGNSPMYLIAIAAGAAISSVILALKKKKPAASK